METNLLCRYALLFVLANLAGCQAKDEIDFKSIVRNAHTLKSQSGTELVIKSLGQPRTKVTKGSVEVWGYVDRANPTSSVTLDFRDNKLIGISIIIGDTVFIKDYRKDANAARL